MLGGTMNAIRNNVNRPHVSSIDCGSPLRSHTYAYDGWNLILERIAHAGGATDEIEYFWGSDLSGSEQGAGGVGGLVALSINGAFYFPCYDNNGNIIAYVDESGSLAAQFAYDAFGNPLATDNSELATLFSLRFSTKYLDPETGFYYYGYRYYDPDLGRWLTRDPIEEQGGLNLYGFCGNNAVNKWDKLGMVEWTVIIIKDIEAHSFGCPEWSEFSGQGDANSYYGHFKKYTLGEWLVPYLRDVPLVLPSHVIENLASEMISGLGMKKGDNQTLWAVTLATKFAYSTKYTKDDRCFRDVQFGGFATLIESMMKGSATPTVVYSGRHANAKKIIARASVQVQ